MLTLTRSRSLPSFEEYDHEDSFQRITNEERSFRYDDFSSQGITKDSFIVSDTTLFEPIAYDGMDKDEKAYILQKFKNHDYMCNVELHKLTGFDVGKPDFKCGPVLQVACITVCNDKLDLAGYKIHGTISATDYVGNSVFIYDRKPDDPEAQLDPEHDLTLGSCPVAHMRGNGLKFDLFDAPGHNIFSTTIFVDYNFNRNCDEDQDVVVQGNHGFYAKMRCSVIPFALIAKVSLKLYGPIHPKTIKVEGEILANGFTFLKHTTFKREWPRKRGSVFNVEQDRTGIAVTGYSDLYVEFDLRSRGKDFANCAMSVAPYMYGIRSSKPSRYCINKEYQFIAKVEWIHPDEYFGILPQIYKPPGAVTADYYVEIFSIFVGCVDSDVPAICGSTVVQDKKETAYIFSRNSRCPDNVSSNGFRGILSLAFPTDRWILEQRFYMHLKLKDAKNQPICRGHVCWFDDGDTCPKRFDKRMCSVIPGHEGYFVAVHYSIFKDGLRAKVTVTVECGDIYEHFDIYGVICAQYNNHDYRSAYDKEYYRIINFNRSYEYRAKVRNCSEIPLSKSLVTAPSDCTGLQVSVSLTVRPYMAPGIAVSDLRAIGNHLFRVDDRNSTEHVLMYCHQSCRPLGRVKVNVDWSI